MVLAWMKRHGGVAEFGRRNKQRSDKLYNLIDQHPDFYVNRVNPNCRSWMNVIFNFSNPELTQLFLKQATDANLKNLKGHRVVGGVRACLYNAMPDAGVDALFDFMKEFVKQHG